jgi:hypothetical protein
MLWPTSAISEIGTGYTRTSAERSALSARPFSETCRPVL